MTISCKVYSNPPAQFGSDYNPEDSSWSGLGIQDATKTTKKNKRGYERRPLMDEEMRTVGVRKVAEESVAPIDW